MKFTAQQFKQLQEIMLGAFTLASLKQMVRFELGENLDSIAGGGNSSEVVFNLLDWAERTGRANDLVEAAHRANSGNPQLKAFYQSWPQTAAPTSAPPTTVSQPVVATQADRDPSSLSFAERAKLIEHLLACPSLDSPGGRANVVSQLPGQIKNSINFAPSANGKQDVTSILQTCLNFNNGLNDLLTVIRFFDDGSTPLARLENTLRELGLNPR